MRLLLKINILFLLIIFELLQYGCYREAYTVQFFSYPPDSKPHEDNWEYRGTVAITQEEKGSFAKKTHKTIKINIKDRTKTDYLFDEFKFFCAGIDAVIKWEHFEKLDISLLEVGNKFEDDDYNRQLLKKGPNELIQLNYTYDPSLSKFVRSKNDNSTGQ